MKHLSNIGKNFLMIPLEMGSWKLLFFSHNDNR